LVTLDCAASTADEESGEESFGVDEGGRGGIEADAC
jgi:hypothetical protein